MKSPTVLCKVMNSDYAYAYDFLPVRLPGFFHIFFFLQR